MSDSTTQLREEFEEKLGVLMNARQGKSIDELMLLVEKTDTFNRALKVCNKLLDIIISDTKRR